MEGRTWWQHLRQVRKRRFALLALLVFMTTGFILGGFVRYTEATAALSRGYDRGLKADAIVVLTGGAKRIEQAVSLLQSGRGQRLLISGVNPGTSRTTLARMTDTDRRLFDCCVDIDMAALDTVGNAQEAIRWAKDHGFDDLILVTSDYHMPRAMLELGSALPDTTLQAYPVATPGFDARGWWRNVREVQRTHAGLPVLHWIELLDPVTSA